MDTWKYSPDRDLAVIGYAPIEEYMFFIIQTVLTSLWALLCVRWSTPCLNFNYEKRSYQLIRWVPITFFTMVMIVGYKLAIPGQGTFYIGCILFWVFPAIIFLCFPFFVNICDTVSKIFSSDLMRPSDPDLPPPALASVMTDFSVDVRKACFDPDLVALRKERR
ncbi:hypothetical protein QTP88_012178 [Uroleucon formosanum]